jgi:transposase
VPDLAQSTLVCDSKFFDARPLGLAHVQGVHWLSLVPASNSKRGEMARRVLEEGRALAVLWRKPGRRKGEEEVFRGSSLVDQIEIEWPREEAEAPLRQRIAVRYLVVHSTQLARQQAQTLARRVREEWGRLGHALAKLQRRRFACQEDALRHAAKWRQINKPFYHQTSFVAQPVTRKASRGRKGRCW